MWNVSVYLLACCCFFCFIYAWIQLLCWQQAKITVQNFTQTPSALFCLLAVISIFFPGTMLIWKTYSVSHIPCPIDSYKFLQLIGQGNWDISKYFIYLYFSFLDFQSLAGGKSFMWINWKETYYSYNYVIKVPLPKKYHYR